jgi:uncharacterized protein YggE
MNTATIVVKGSASDEFPADFAVVQFSHQFIAPARSEALAEGNAVVAQLRDTTAQAGAGVREMKVRSLRVEETFNLVGPDRVREQSGWTAQMAGELLAEPGSVREFVAALIKVGVSINHISWHLDPDTEKSAHRAVRRLAVADAVDAANDFAVALGGNVGRLITLADPGLLGAVTLQNGPRRSSRSSGTAFATAGGSATSWDQQVDIDPDLITISANVEASYEVTLD